MSSGASWDDDGNIGLASAMFISQAGEVSFHPDAVATVNDAYGCSGELRVGDDPGALLWKRGQGLVTGKGWQVCVGDAVWQAIQDGRLPSPACGVGYPNKPGKSD